VEDPADAVELSDSVDVGVDSEGLAYRHEGDRIGQGASGWFGGLVVFRYGWDWGELSKLLTDNVYICRLLG
jgi:hypothetical protein